MDADWLNRAGILAEAVSFVLIAPEIIGLERLRRVETALAALGRRTLSTPTRTWTGERASARGPLRLLPDRPAPKDRSTLWDLGDELGAFAFFGLVPMPLIIFLSPSTYFAVYGAFFASYMAGSVAILLLMRSARMKLLAWPLAAIGFPTHWGRALASDLGYLLLRALLSLGVRLLSETGRLRVFVFGTGVLLLFGGMTAQFVATF